MKPTDASNLSFNVRIWREDEISGSSRPCWRGHVTHLGDGTRRHVVGLNEVTRFIACYLEEAGIGSTGCSRRWSVRRWLGWETKYASPEPEAMSAPQSPGDRGEP